MKLPSIFYQAGFILFTVVNLTACRSDIKTTPMFSSQNDILYASQLWKAMEKNQLVGKQAKPLQPFFGGAKPHGMILEIYSNPLIVGQHSGFLVLKRNYNGDGVTVDSVSKNRSKYLTSITIMYQRESGYDQDNLNFFWAKYKPNGTLFSKEMMGRTLQLAGRLMKGASPKHSKGCIYCHSSAGGGDYIFYPEIKLPGFQYSGE